jgi:hypothetical protein
VSPELNIRNIDPDHAVATWDCVLLQIWRLDVQAQSVARLEGTARMFMRATPSRISSLAIIEATATPPNQAARAALSKFYRELAGQMLNAIVVPEGSGFRGAFVRGVGVALSALSPRALPFKFVGTVNEAASLVESSLSPQAGGARGLLDRIEQLRREIPKRPSVRLQPR